MAELTIDDVLLSIYKHDCPWTDFMGYDFVVQQLIIEGYIVNQRGWLRITDKGKKYAREKDLLGKEIQE